MNEIFVSTGSETKGREKMINPDFEYRRCCPCGKGEYVHRGHENEMGGISSEQYVMLCPHCVPLYTYVWEQRRDYPTESRGWVLNSVLEEERAYQDRVAKTLEFLYRDEWKSQLASCRTKTDLWRVLTCDGRYYPAYSTFLEHEKGRKFNEIVQHVTAMPFGLHSLYQVLDVCRIAQPNWDLLGVKAEDRGRPSDRYVRRRS